MAHISYRAPAGRHLPAEEGAAFVTPGALVSAVDTTPVGDAVTALGQVDGVTALAGTELGAVESALEAVDTALDDGEGGGVVPALAAYISAVGDLSFAVGVVAAAVADVGAVEGLLEVEGAAPALEALEAATSTLADTVRGLSETMTGNPAPAQDGLVVSIDTQTMLSFQQVRDALYKVRDILRQSTHFPVVPGEE